MHYRQEQERRQRDREQRDREREREREKERERQVREREREMQQQQRRAQKRGNYDSSNTREEWGEAKRQAMQYDTSRYKGVGVNRYLFELNPIFFC